MSNNLISLDIKITLRQERPLKYILKKAREG